MNIGQVLFVNYYIRENHG